MIKIIIILLTTDNNSQAFMEFHVIPSSCGLSYVTQSTVSLSLRVYEGTYMVHVKL